MKRALLVNDSKFESLILKDMLQKMNYLVEIADEFDALYSLERFEPHVVIVNYVMQQTSGDKLIRLMKAGMPKVKCLLSSNSNIRLADFQGGYVDGIVHTPVSKFLLESVLESIGDYADFEEEEEDDDEIEERRCDSCGRSLEDFQRDITFCPYCGYSLL